MNLRLPSLLCYNLLTCLVPLYRETLYPIFALKPWQFNFRTAIGVPCHDEEDHWERWRAASACQY